MGSSSGIFEKMEEGLNAVAGRCLLYKVLALKQLVDNSWRLALLETKKGEIMRLSSHFVALV